jgi:uncharacterized protein YbcI
MADGQASESPEHGRGGTAHAISNMVVGVLNDYTGRGPTRASTYIQEDLITVVLRDTLTRGERTLVDGGEEKHVLETRMMYQQRMRGAIVAAVEELTGRRVLAFLSANHIDPDLAIESIVLEPVSSGGEREPSAQ